MPSIRTLPEGWQSAEGDAACLRDKKLKSGMIRPAVNKRNGFSSSQMDLSASNSARKNPSCPHRTCHHPIFSGKKAEECVALSYQINDPKKQVAILKLASWWMRLAEQYINKNSHHDTK